MYGLLSLVFIVIGFLIYFLFRDLSRLVFFSWLPMPAFLNTVLAPLDHNTSIFSYFVKFNLPDMLWFVSGILFLRCIWFYKVKVQAVYILVFYIIGLLLEVSQLSDAVPGTFDWFDLLFIGIGALAEGIIYKKFIYIRVKAVQKSF